MYLPSWPSNRPKATLVMPLCRSGCLAYGELCICFAFSAAAADADVSLIPRDQGFVRAKVLLLLPMRNMAFKVVRRLVALAQKETRVDSVQGKEKFVEQFAGEDDGQEEQGEQQQQGGKGSRRQKPSEFRGLFSGNPDDHFRSVEEVLWSITHRLLWKSLDHED